MTTLIIKNNNVHARHFIEYARSLPYVEVVEAETRRFKPEVEKALRDSKKGVGLVRCEDAQDMFKRLGW